MICKVCRGVRRCYKRKIISDDRLTDRECIVFCMLENRLTTKEIAEVLKISTNTVSVHRKNIRKKILNLLDKNGL